MKTRLNLAAHRFPRYRRTNFLLGAVLLASLAGGAWLVSDYYLNPPDIRSLAGTEQELRKQWEGLGRRTSEIEGRLRRPEAAAMLSELTFLGQVMARKQFSWTRVLGEIESVMPPGVYLVGLLPDISEEGDVFLEMEARGQTYGDLSRFMTNLELTDAFRDVKVAEDETGVDGGDEIRVVMGANYVGVALAEVSVPGD